MSNNGEKEYSIYGIGSYSKYLGTVKANSKEEAIEKAYDELKEEMYVSLCYQCSSIDVTDMYELEANVDEK